MVKRYSSGMYLRLAFAGSTQQAGSLVDEVLAVGDAEFQQCGKMTMWLRKAAHDVCRP